MSDRYEAFDGFADLGGLGVVPDRTDDLRPTLAPVPAGVDPARVRRAAERALARFVQGHTGVRHAPSYAGSLEINGRLDEAFGQWWKCADYAGLGAREWRIGAAVDAIASGAGIEYREAEQLVLEFLRQGVAG